MKKKKLHSIWFLKNKVQHKTKKKKNKKKKEEEEEEEDKSLQILITIINNYNPHNNIKFAKEKKKWKKIYPLLDFLKVKYHTKRKRKITPQFTI